MITVSMCVRIGGVRARDPDRMGVGTAQVGSRLRVGTPVDGGSGLPLSPIIRLFMLTWRLRPEVVFAAVTTHPRLTTSRRPWSARRRNVPWCSGRTSSACVLTTRRVVQPSASRVQQHTYQHARTTHAPSTDHLRPRTCQELRSLLSMGYCERSRSSRVCDQPTPAMPEHASHRCRLGLQ